MLFHAPCSQSHVKTDAGALKIAFMVRRPMFLGSVLFCAWKCVIEEETIVLQ